MADKIRAFNWEVLEINGHDLEEIYVAIEKAKSSDVPTAIIANTIKGKGVSFAENAGPDCHSMPISKEALEKCGINMKDLQSYKDNDAIYNNSKLEDLIKTYKFLKHIEIERNEICTKLFKSGAMRYGYFDDREERASKALNTTAENAVDIFYNSQPENY